MKGFYRTGVLSGTGAGGIENVGATQQNKCQYHQIIDKPDNSTAANANTITELSSTPAVGTKCSQNSIITVCFDVQKKYPSRREALLLVPPGNILGMNNGADQSKTQSAERNDRIEKRNHSTSKDGYDKCKKGSWLYDMIVKRDVRVFTTQRISCSF